MSTTNLTPRQVTDFTSLVYEFYHTHPRNLAWRETTDPYRILLSEMMLQQTQVSRVREKYDQFLEAFPTVHDLADAELSEVLRLWRGLGYNRRALSLKRTAEEIVARYDGSVPDDPTELRTLPGIGPYTAAAICVFAFGRPEPLIETNIRRVFIHHFFADREDVRDSEIMPLVEQTYDRDNPRDWIYALMDYGVHLKSAVPNPNRRSAHYTKQAKFEGSNRQIRGMVLRAVTDDPVSHGELVARIDRDPARVGQALDQLVEEGFIVRDGDGDRYRIA